MSLWSEIKQRRITQIVLAYLAGGWMVLAVVDQVVDREVLPLVVYETALTLYLIGIIAALIVGWYHGELGAQMAPPREIVLLSLVGVLAVVASATVIRNASADATVQDAMNTADLRRVAVLYLDDLSRDGSMQVVADGITEGLISALTTVRELDVSSRWAAREARDLGDVSPDSIARMLQVGALVDGAVDRAGENVRVSIRLLEGTSGAPLFRETFTWPADDVASIGTELAAELSNVLREQIGGEIRVREARATAPNAAAWLQVARAEQLIRSAADAVQAGDAHGVAEALEAADVELVAAQESAPGWARPLVLRSQVAYEWYVLLQANVEELVETLDLAVQHANAALALEPDDAAALEWRGTALYRRWLTRWDDGPDADRLLARAQADLERAQTLDPSRASASSTLSHLYYQIDDWPGAVLAARTAYERDAFLDVADGVLWRLYTASYDLGEHGAARQWCEEGYRRFPHNFRFTQCRIFLLTMPAAQADIDRAWALHAELRPLLTERPEFFDAQARIFIGGVIGRAGLADSANSVFADARLDAELDPDRELLSMEAAMRSVIGDADGSIAALERFMVVNPDHAPGRHWWWTNVERHPAFERLRAQH
jgi:eukaryotic-like serine/threonine-protein kinase